MKMRSMGMNAVLLLVAITTSAVTVAPVGAQRQDVRCDINADGHADVAVGVPEEGVRGARRAGAVHVFYGGAVGLRPDGDDLWHQGDAGIQGAPEARDRLGSSIACADFDGDGFADVAAGAHLEGIGDVRAGAVQVWYGSSDGVSARDDLWHQDDDGVDGVATAGDKFGRALAAGYLDGDEYADLIVGIPATDVSGRKHAGAVQILYGSREGVSARNDLWDQASAGVASHAGGRDHFGAAVAAGDLNGDGFDDAVVGIPGEKIAGEDGAGAVQVLFGSADGVTSSGEFWHQDSEGVPGSAGTREGFGSAVTAADFDVDGFDDLVVGVPGEGVGGAVTVIYGSSGGARARTAQWHQDVEFLRGAAEQIDYFGAAVETGDFDSDRLPDLAVGVPGESVGGQEDAGAVQVIFGEQEGLGRRNELWHQNDDNMSGHAEPGDMFGFALFAGDFNADGHDDLAIGVPGESVGAREEAGAMQTIDQGIGSSNAAGELWHQGDPGVNGAPEAGDTLGRALP